MYRFHLMWRARTVERLRLLPRHNSTLLYNSCNMLSRCISYIVTTANFDQEVLQSQQAICLVYYINNRSCMAYLRSAEKLVDQLNAITSDEASAPRECGKAEEMVKGKAETRSTEIINSKTLQDDHNNTDCHVDKSKELDKWENVKQKSLQSINSTTTAAAAAANTCNNTDTTVAITTTSNAADIDDIHECKGAEVKRKGKTNVWLKLCTINADENRNLASTFSVERAKLPITYFIMQSTIIDRVVGQINENRLQSILVKFLEHYQKELNVNLLSKRNRENLCSVDGMASPLPRASSADLISDTSTQFLQNKIMAALVGPEMIRLPEEIAETEGLRKTIQQAKEKASKELRQHQQSLGMDLRKLSEHELQYKYYKSTPFITLGVISALEALFLARLYANIGNIDRKQVEWAHTSLLKDFNAAMSDTNMRRVVALIEANLLKGDLFITRTRIRKAVDYIYHKSYEEEEQREAKLQYANTNSCVSWTNDEEYCKALLNIIDEHIDTRIFANAFPVSLAEELFTSLKSELKAARLEENNMNSQGNTSTENYYNSGRGSVEYSANNVENKRNNDECNEEYNNDNDTENQEKTYARIGAKQRAREVQTIIRCLLQMYPTDPAGQSVRSRLSSILY